MTTMTHDIASGAPILYAGKLRETFDAIVAGARKFDTIHREMEGGPCLVIQHDPASRSYSLFLVHMKSLIKSLDVGLDMEADHGEGILRLRPHSGYSIQPDRPVQWSGREVA